MSKKPGELRIISGRWRGRKIKFSTELPLRPTLDRIRETAFNWLMHDIEGAVCLDLFAGSGALGFEALSRGAAQVTFVDREPAVLDSVRHNAELFDVSSQVDRVLGACPDGVPVLKQAPFDIVFLDPPFQQGLVKKAAFWLEEKKYLSEHALIFMEIEGRVDTLPTPTHWKILHHKMTSTLTYALLLRSADSAS